MFIADWLVNGFSIGNKWRQYIHPGEEAHGMTESWILIGWQKSREWQWRVFGNLPLSDTIKPLGKSKQTIPSGNAASLNKTHKNFLLGKKLTIFKSLFTHATDILNFYYFLNCTSTTSKLVFTKRFYISDLFNADLLHSSNTRHLKRFSISLLC